MLNFPSYTQTVYLTEGSTCDLSGYDMTKIDLGNHSFLLRIEYTIKFSHIMY